MNTTKIKGLCHILISEMCFLEIAERGEVGDIDNAIQQTIQDIKCEVEDDD